MLTHMGDGSSCALLHLASTPPTLPLETRFRMDKTTGHTRAPALNIHGYYRVFSAAIGSICAISQDPEFIACSILCLLAAIALSALSEGILRAIISVTLLSYAAFRSLWLCFRPGGEFTETCAEMLISKEQANAASLSFGAPNLSGRRAMATPDILVSIMEYLDLHNRAHLSGVSRSAQNAYKKKSLWKEVVVPDACQSINLAVRAIPRRIRSSSPGFVPKIRVRPGNYFEGDPRGLLVMFKRRPSGVYIDKPVIIENFSLGVSEAGESLTSEVGLRQVEAKNPQSLFEKKDSKSKASSPSASPTSPSVTILGNAGEAITIAKSAKNVQLRGLRILINRFSSHGVAVYSGGAVIERCEVRATGTNACGILVSGPSVSADVRECVIGNCGGSGLLLAYNSGPVLVDRCDIRNNRWSGIGAFAGSSLSISNTVIEKNSLFAVGAAVQVKCELGPGNRWQDNGRGDSVHRYLAYKHE